MKCGTVSGGSKTQQIRFFNWTDYKQISMVKIQKLTKGAAKI